MRPLITPSRFFPRWHRAAILRNAAGDPLVTDQGDPIVDALGNPRTSDGEGDDCCCETVPKVCWYRYTCTYTCATAVWTAWTYQGVTCEVPDAHPENTRVKVSSTGVGSSMVCTYEQYIKGAACTVSGDCATAPSAPTTETGVPGDCCFLCGGCSMIYLPRRLCVSTTAYVTLEYCKEYQIEYTGANCSGTAITAGAGSAPQFGFEVRGTGNLTRVADGSTTVFTYSGTGEYRWLDSTGNPIGSWTAMNVSVRIGCDLKWGFNDPDNEFAGLFQQGIGHTGSSCSVDSVGGDAGWVGNCTQPENFKRYVELKATLHNNECCNDHGTNACRPGNGDCVDGECDNPLP